MNDREAMARLIDALRPWLGHLVIVGGWAHQLHRFHPRAKAPGYEPLRTRDADIAFSGDAPLVGDIGAALRAADFREELRAEHTPPVTHFSLGDSDQGFYAEFLAPLHGDGVRRRDRSPDVTILKAGVTAQKLRYLDLLMTQPWILSLGTKNDLPLAKGAMVSTANPVSFIAQKILIHKRRSPNKRAQDILYIHDTLELFGHDLPGLRSEWVERVEPTLTATTARSVRRLARNQFATVTDVIREASRMPQDRVLRPERLQEVCAYGLEQILGG